MTFSSFLFQWKEYIPYISLDILEEPERSERIIELLGDLTRFYHFELIPARPEMPVIPHLDVYQRQKGTVLLSRKHFFIQWRVFRKKIKIHQKAITFLDGLCDAIKSLKDNEAPAIVKIKTKELYAKLLQISSEKTNKLIACDSAITRQISRDCLYSDSSMASMSSIQQILASARPQFDRSSMFISEHPLQMKFEDIIFSDDFPFKADVDQLFIKKEMIDEQMFTMSVVKAMQKIVRGLGLTDVAEVSMFSIFFFRAIFDLAYVINKKFFVRDYKPVFRQLSDKITFDMTGIPREVSDAEFIKERIDMKIYDIVQSNEMLKEAAKMMTSLSFLNSPLDILATIHRILSTIREFSNKVLFGDKKNENAQSFDSIFGLFILVLVGSDLANVEEVFWYSNTFSPMDGLSGQLEYAKATASAVLMQITNIIKQVRKAN